MAKFHDLWHETGIPPAHRALIEQGQLRRREEWWAAFNQLRASLQPGRVGSVCALIGDFGVGKTQLAALLCHAMIKEHERRCLYVRAEDVMDALHDARKRTDGQLLAVLRSYRVPYLLVVDELDKRAGTYFEDRTWSRLIDERYAQGRATLLMGNLTRADFEAEMDPSVLSRMDERGLLIEASWESFRPPPRP